MHHQTGYSDI